MFYMIVKNIKAYAYTQLIYTVVLLQVKYEPSTLYTANDI